MVEYGGIFGDIPLSLVEFLGRIIRFIRHLSWGESQRENLSKVKPTGGHTEIDIS